MSQSFLVAIVLLSLPLVGFARMKTHPKDPCVLRASQVKHRAKQHERSTAQRAQVASKRSSVPLHTDRTVRASAPRASSGSVHAATFFARHSGIPFYTDTPIYSPDPQRKARHIQAAAAASSKAKTQVPQSAKSAAHPKTSAQQSVAGEHKESNPAYARSYPRGAKAQCFDATYSRDGSCAGHGGVFLVIPRR